MVGEHPVELLGHRAVERAHPGLDVRDRDTRLCARERPGRASSSCRRRRAPRRERPPRRPARARRASAPSARCSSPARSRAPGPGTAARARRRTRPTARRRSAGRCGSAAPGATAQRAETAAALMNCGRLPITVRTFIGRRRAPRGSGRQRPPPLGHSPDRGRRTRGCRPPRRPGPRGSSRQGTPRRPRAAPRACSSAPGARHLDHDRARDRGEDVIVERRRQHVAVLDPEDRAGRSLEHPAVRRHQQRLVESLLAREPRREHVRRVRQRLDAVEHPRRRVGDGREPSRPVQRRQRLGQQQSPPAARDHDPQRLVVWPATGVREQPVASARTASRSTGSRRFAADRDSRAGAPRARTAGRRRRGSPRTRRRRGAGLRRSPGSSPRMRA